MKRMIAYTPNCKKTREQALLISVIKTYIALQFDKQILIPRKRYHPYIKQTVFQGELSTNL